MVVVSSRQVGLRPETIRTRLARFMPTRVSAGWSIAWSAHTERPEEITHEDELRAAEHLGCYGSAVAHALAQAEIAAVRLRVTAEAAGEADGTAQPITVEVRCEIPGPALDQAIVEGIARRAETGCPVWKSLVAEAGLRVIVILDEPTDPDAEETPSPTLATTRDSAPKSVPNPAARLRGWLTPKMALVAVGVVVVALRAFLLFSS